MTTPPTNGPHTTPTPPPQHDHHLETLIHTHQHQTPAALADTLTQHGYTAPTPIHQWEHLTNHPPTSILTDKHGQPWSAASIPQTTFEPNAPWTLVYQPTPPTITNLTPPPTQN